MTSGILIFNSRIHNRNLCKEKWGNDVQLYVSMIKKFEIPKIISEFKIFYEKIEGNL